LADVRPPPQPASHPRPRIHIRHVNPETETNLIQHQWVAIHNGKVIAAGDSLLKVSDAATAENGHPYIARVGEEDATIFRVRHASFACLLFPEFGALFASIANKARIAAARTHWLGSDFAVFCNAGMALWACRPISPSALAASIRTPPAGSLSCSTHSVRVLPWCEGSGCAGLNRITAPKKSAISEISSPNMTSSLRRGFLRLTKCWTASICCCRVSRCAFATAGSE